MNCVQVVIEAPCALDLVKTLSRIGYLIELKIFFWNINKFVKTCYTVFDIYILFAIFISAIGKNLRRHALLLFVYKADALEQAEHFSW